VVGLYSGHNLAKSCVQVLKVYLTVDLRFISGEIQAVKGHTSDRTPPAVVTSNTFRYETLIRVLGIAYIGNRKRISQSPSDLILLRISSFVIHPVHCFDERRRTRPET